MFLLSHIFYIFRQQKSSICSFGDRYIIVSIKLVTDVVLKVCLTVYYSWSIVCDEIGTFMFGKKKKAAQKKKKEKSWD